jgi:hypothetical protein
MESNMRRILLLLMMAVLPATVLAAASPEPQNPKLRSLREQVAALQLDHALNLSQQQARALLPVLQAAKAQIQAFQGQRAAAEPALTSALTQAVADLKATGAISPATAQAVNAARPSPQALRDGLRQTWQQARQVLTADQLTALRGAQLGVPRDDAAAGAPTGHHGFARRFRVAHLVLSDAFIALAQARAG